MCRSFESSIRFWKINLLVVVFNYLQLTSSPLYHSYLAGNVLPFNTHHSHPDYNFQPTTAHHFRNHHLPLTINDPFKHQVRSLINNPLHIPPPSTIHYPKVTIQDLQSIIHYSTSSICLSSHYSHSFFQSFLSVIRPLPPCEFLYHPSVSNIHHPNRFISASNFCSHLLLFPSLLFIFTPCPLNHPLANTHYPGSTVQHPLFTIFYLSLHHPPIYFSALTFSSPILPSQSFTIRNSLSRIYSPSSIILPLLSVPPTTIPIPSSNPSLSVIRPFYLLANSSSILLFQTSIILILSPLLTSPLVYFSSLLFSCIFSFHPALLIILYHKLIIQDLQFIIHYSTFSICPFIHYSHSFFQSFPFS